ncbi:pentatricopeptide repeat-containing protein At2g22070 isoform X2 [Cryptomeria japonica]|uniref:pentatricopeptide repeat-containing protein At2g22070 isoform X2 n=1 Tax=Cryptomeria japonica TaxID=3369 RepID=UPI0027DA136B|nr:pentatricopeptide repeat-containing protein At2g22070 isoform X2 [Cryptomeria japonica]
MSSTAHFNLNLKVLCTEGHLKEALHVLLNTRKFPAHSSTYINLLQACIDKKALSEGKQIHSHINDRGFTFSTHPLLQNKLISMYEKCGSLENARKVLDNMTEPDVSSWNIMITAYRRHGISQGAFALFHRMQQTLVQPDHFTFSTILPVCANLGSLKTGMQIHGKVVRCGFHSHVTVTNTLIDMYAKCGSIERSRELFDKMPNGDVVSWNAMITGYAQKGVLDEALRLFKEMPQRTVVSWTAIIAGYAQNNLGEKALEAFKLMQLSGEKADSATFASTLPACAKMGALEQGMEIHQKVIESDFLSSVVVLSALIDMYGKCGSIQKARDLFVQMPQRNVVSWNAMIVGYAQNGLGDKALETFKLMQIAGAKPSPSTFASVLPACAKLGALEQGYAMHGYTKDAVELFEKMKHSGTNPDHVSFVCVFFACSHAGLVDDACKFFNSMSETYSIMPSMDHYVCMVDLLGRVGYLEETVNFIIKIPVKLDVVVWMSLLGACRTHKDIRLGESVATRLFELDPKNPAPFVLLSNIYALAGKWGDAQKVRKLMEEMGIKKIPGCSWIEVHKIVHAFCVGDRSHPQTQAIYTELEKLSWEMKAAGYIPDTKPIFNDVEEEEKELLLCHHSEKLAIAFGLLNTPPGTTIRVVKNLRVCSDCHTSTKFISKIISREIIVRDANRFHHFKYGRCSCEDYW